MVHSLAGLNPTLPAWIGRVGPTANPIQNCPHNARTFETMWIFPPAMCVFLLAAAAPAIEARAPAAICQAQPHRRRLGRGLAARGGRTCPQAPSCSEERSVVAPVAGWRQESPGSATRANHPWTERLGKASRQLRRERKDCALVRTEPARAD